MSLLCYASLKIKKEHKEWIFKKIQIRCSGKKRKRESRQCLQSVNDGFVRCIVHKASISESIAAVKAAEVMNFQRFCLCNKVSRWFFRWQADSKAKKQKTTKNKQTETHKDTNLGCEFNFLKLNGSIDFLAQGFSKGQFFVHHLTEDKQQECVLIFLVSHVALELFLHGLHDTKLLWLYKGSNDNANGLHITAVRGDSWFETLLCLLTMFTSSSRTWSRKCIRAWACDRRMMASM